MDHVVNGMMSHYSVLLDLFVEEHQKCEYKKLSDNSYYQEIRALIDAINILHKYLGWDPIKLSEEVKEKM